MLCHHAQDSTGYHMARHYHNRQTTDDSDQEIQPVFDLSLMDILDRRSDQKEHP